jgi:hypothetical protein
LSLLQAGLEPPDEGWKQLQKQIAEYKPTIAVLGYGMASSFAGDAGLPKFKADYARLLAHLKSVVPEVRFLFLSPITHEWLEGYPNPAEHNRQLLAYGRAIEEIAREERSLFVNLSGGMGWGNREAPSKNGITENGIHLKEAGYLNIAGAIEKALGLPNPIGNRMPQAIPAYPHLRAVILRKNDSSSTARARPIWPTSSASETRAGPERGRDAAVRSDDCGGGEKDPRVMQTSERAEFQARSPRCSPRRCVRNPLSRSSCRRNIRTSSWVMDLKSRSGPRTRSSRNRSR